MISHILSLFGIGQSVSATFARESAEQMAWENGHLVRQARGPVLMLDIDGVLHPAQSGSLIYLPMLEDWLRTYPIVDVVVSSNWRDTHTLAELRALFSDDIQSRIIGTTPNLDGENREDEIIECARRHGIVSWAALDDRAQDFPRTASTRLVATEYFDGIGSSHLDQLAILLRVVPGNC